VHETGWCAIEITDINKRLVFRVEEPFRGGHQVISRAREWVQNFRRADPDYPISDKQWVEQTICSDLIKAVVWDRGDVLPDLGRALIKLTGFHVALVQGTSDGVPGSLTELLVPGEALCRDFESFPAEIV
jgi:hypothetical protein